MNELAVIETFFVGTAEKQQQLDKTSSSSSSFEKPSHQLLDAGNLIAEAPSRNWCVRRLPDRSDVLVRIVKSYESSKLNEEDPFGDRWDSEIATFLLEIYLKCGMLFQETISAQRITYDDAFAYHIYFEAVESKTRKTCNIFGEVEISRACLTSFVPKVHFCQIIDATHDYDEGCPFCQSWVPHPKRRMETIRKEACQGGYMKPRVSYISANVEKFLPRLPVPQKRFWNGKGMSNSKFKALLLKDGVPAEEIEKLRLSD